MFLVQAFTGLLLMTAYSPSSSTAWGSVYYINYEMWLGWFIRGVHHYAAQAMIALLAFHLLQVLWTAAYLRPREFTWWFGVALLIVTVGFGHTGYQLPWDQKGYWATKVVTNIVGGAPVFGPYAQKLLVGGTEYGNQTLTRFFALHVAVLPSLFVALPRRSRRPGPPEGTHTPGADRRERADDAVLAAPVVPEHGLHHGRDRRGRGDRAGAGGAHLDAPADPSSADYPARPEWYFLSLYQMLKYFPGNREVIGTFVIPSVLLFVLFLLPFFERVFTRRIGHVLACGFVFGVVGGAGYLTAQALIDDARNVQFHEARAKADAVRERALELASLPEAGIPPDGATYLLRRDPMTQGKAVLERRCLGCHVLGGQGMGEQSAPDLANYGTRAWLRGLLENPQSTAYFGKVPDCDGMNEWKKNSKLNSKQLDAIADFVASFAEIPAGMTPDEWLSSPGVAEHPGLEPFQKECGTCHLIEGFTDGEARARRPGCLPGARPRGSPG